MCAKEGGVRGGGKKSAGNVNLHYDDRDGGGDAGGKHAVLCRRCVGGDAGVGIIIDINTTKTKSTDCHNHRHLH